MRLAAALTAVLLTVAGLAGVALAYTETASDDFSSGGYGGGSGWKGSWKEVGNGDQVGVESHSTCSAGQCLVISRPLLSLGLRDTGARRTVDLASATSATLSYDLTFSSLLVGQMEVAALVDGDEVERRTHGPSRGTYTLDLPVGDDVTIQFLVTGIDVLAAVGIDNVEVEIEYPDPTTTTTTTTTTTRPTTTTTTTAPPSTTTTTSGSTTPTTRRSTTTTTSTTAASTSTTAAQDDTSPTRRPDPDSGPTSHSPVGEPDDTTRTTSGPDTTPTTGQAEGGSTTTTSRGDGVPSSTTTSSTTAPADEAITAQADDDQFRPEPREGNVVRGFDPGLGRAGWSVEAQDGLLVVFGRAVEDIALDIMASAGLGLVLAWASLRKMG